MPGLEQAEQAIEAHLPWQAKGVRLERVGRENSVHVNDRFALVLGQFAGQQAANQFFHVRVAQVQPVASAIAQKTIVPNAGADDATGFILFLEEQIIIAQMIGAGKGSEAGVEEQCAMLFHSRYFPRSQLSSASRNDT